MRTMILAVLVLAGCGPAMSASDGGAVVDAGVVDAGGGGAEGSPCYANADCGAGLWCTAAIGLSCPGACAKQSPPGASCDQATDECTDGYYCGARSCVPVPPQVVRQPGQSCSASPDCTAGYYCPEATITCTAIPAIGSPCDPSVSDGCGGVSKAWCDPASNTCAELPGDGGDCSVREYDGGAGRGFEAVLCAEGFYCLSDVCMPKLAPGSTCEGGQFAGSPDVDVSCASGQCVNGTCAGPCVRP